MLKTLIILWSLGLGLMVLTAVVARAFDYDVRVADGGKNAIATHANAAAVTKTVGTEYKVPLSSFAGSDLNEVKRLCIGVGDRETPVAGGTSRLHIDDVRVTKP